MKKVRGNKLALACFLLPALILFTAIVIIPIFMSAYYYGSGPCDCYHSHINCILLYEQKNPGQYDCRRCKGLRKFSSVVDKACNTKLMLSSLKKKYFREEGFLIQENGINQKNMS